MNTQTAQVRSSDIGQSLLRPLSIMLVGVLGFALLTALSAHLKLPLPFTPVPVTLQTAAALLAGLTMGPALGLLSMAAYLLLGALGAPAFALGQGALLGVTGGYLFGFLLAQPVFAMTNAPRASWGKLLAATLLGHAVIFACGVAWMVWSLQIDLPRGLELGLYPFVLGTLLKSALVVAAAPTARRLWAAALGR